MNNETGKCHSCNSEKNISNLNELCCAVGGSKCKYKKYECNSCRFYIDLCTTRRVVVANKLESIQFKEHIRYTRVERFDPELYYNVKWDICICNECNNDSYEQKIKDYDLSKAPNDGNISEYISQHLI
jgi:hypothetical protein